VHCTIDNIYENGINIFKKYRCWKNEWLCEFAFLKFIPHYLNYKKISQLEIQKNHRNLSI